MNPPTDKHHARLPAEGTPDIADRKILDRAELLAVAAASRRDRQRIVFTNGCFDLLHAGHVRYLAAARACGDILVVGLNSDASVRAIKGPQRPVVAQQERAEVLAALACVNFVVLFDTPDPLPLIRALRPDVLVKGADWKLDEIVGADLIREDGGRVVRIELVPGVSTSAIIDTIVRRFGNRPDPAVAPNKKGSASHDAGA